MVSKYRAYTEYKDSGVEWLGETPKHWQLAELKRYAFVKGGYAFNSDSFIEDGEPVIRISDIKQDGSVSLENCKCVSDKQANQYGEFSVSSGELVMAMTGATIGKAGLYSYSKPALINQRVGVFKCNEKYLDYKFLWYVLSSYGYQVHIKLTAFGGAQPNISDTGMVGYKAVIPIKEEQLKIARFLDHETAKIDTLIEKQQQLIKLLKEKRQAVISHAVTKGLNPNAKMRDSGVEWLGEVPEHWEVTRAKFLFCFVTSGSRGWAEYYSDEGSLFFRIANLTRDTIEPKMESTQKVMPPSGSEGVRSKINKGDLLISITADLGSVCVANDEIEGGYVSQHVALCRPNENVESSRWLAYFILSDLAKEQFIGSGYGGTKIQLSLEDIRELWIIRPAGKYQIEIASYIDKQMEKFSKLIGFAEKQIILLQERRTALISAAVTGKIDVRDWQPSNGQR